jgi:hypothetical protein
MLGNPESEEPRMPNTTPRFLRCKDGNQPKDWRRWHHWRVLGRVEGQCKPRLEGETRRETASAVSSQFYVFHHMEEENVLNPDPKPPFPSPRLPLSREVLAAESAAIAR